MYDFHKCRRSVTEIQFRHPFFQRDRPDLLGQIKRKTNSGFNQAANTYQGKKADNDEASNASANQRMADSNNQSKSLESYNTLAQTAHKQMMSNQVRTSKLGSQKDPS